MSKKLFDKKYVFCMWDDKLSGREVFIADYISDLMEYAEENDVSDLMEYVEENYISDLMEYAEENDVSCRRDYVLDSGDIDYPFAVHHSLEEVKYYRFVYYDPLYDIKRAYYKEGKTIQYWDEECLLWKDVQYEPNWDLGSIKYRIKEV